MESDASSSLLLVVTSLSSPLFLLFIRESASAITFLFPSSNTTRVNKSQRNYPIYDKELFAIKAALEEWRHYLEGSRHQFIIYTDHKNLTSPRKPKMLSQRQIRWNEFLSRFNFKLIYRAGKKSGKPDILSRRSDHLFNVSRIVS